MLLERERRIMRCPVCSLVFTELLDQPIDARSYAEAYYRDGVYTDYLGDRGVMERNARRVLAELAVLTAGRRLLDVGCAAGFFLAAARDAGWSVRGLELSAYMAEYARREFGLAVELGTIEATQQESSSYDVVTMWDTVEHLSHPRRGLANIRRLLGPGGVLVLSTGDHGSIMRRVTGRRWRLFADPTHNYFFDEMTLRRLLALTGFRVLRVIRRGKWVSLSMILQQSGLPFSADVQKWLAGQQSNPSFYVNPRDVMTVYARASE